MSLLRVSLTVILAIASTAAVAADLPARYTVDEKQLKAAVATTNLTFQLYSDPLCTSSVYMTTVAIENVDLIGRIKPFNPKNAVKKKNTAELRATLTAVPPGPSLYLKVTGTGVVPIGGACQVQASGLSGPSGPGQLVVKDSNSATLGIFDGQSGVIYDDGGTLIKFVNVTQTGFQQEFLFSTYQVSTDCSGPQLIPLYASLVASAPIVGTTAYYAPTSGANTSVSSQLYRSGAIAGPFTSQATCDAFFGLGNSTFVAPDGCCQTFPSFMSPFGQAITVDVSGFVPPFSIQ
jgi:hypothetical protein